jgi:hypothetical protein
MKKENFVTPKEYLDLRRAELEARIAIKREEIDRYTGLIAVIDQIVAERPQPVVTVAPLADLFATAAETPLQPVPVPVVKEHFGVVIPKLPLQDPVWGLRANAGKAIFEFLKNDKSGKYRTLNYIAARLALTPGTVSGAVSRLRKAGYVKPSLRRGEGWVFAR